MATTPINGIFDILGAINQKQYLYYQKLPTENQKAIAPFVLQRWLYSTPRVSQLMVLNSVVNPYTFSLYQHKDLLWKLLCITHHGTPVQYRWKKSNTPPKTVADKVAVISQYHNVSMSEAKFLSDRYTEGDIEDMKQDLGISK